MNKYLLLVFLAAIAGCGQSPDDVVAHSTSYAIDAKRITVSGVSSGGYMAGQLHMAHSDLFGGAAIVAAGPYYCAQGDISTALGPCMTGGELNGDTLLESVGKAFAGGKIDDPANLGDDRVWLFHGALDTVVDLQPSKGAASLYAQLMPEDSVVLIQHVEAVHGLATLDTGSPCDTFATPFLNACDFDSAGEILAHLYGTTDGERAAAGELLEVPQPGSDEALMLENALLYVPPACEDGAACGVHVVLHGCSQSSEFVGDAFAKGAGFNEWADAYNLIVLYPQVDASKIAPMNPYGCWDWWGYTNEDYATQAGPQIRSIKAQLDSLAGKTL